MMLGVVIWSCQRTGRAIVWCADHRELAHDDGPAQGTSRVRIEVGYGLEGALPDATANRIIEEDIVPQFRRGDFAGGIATGVDRSQGVPKTAGPAPPPTSAATPGASCRCRADCKLRANRSTCSGAGPTSLAGAAWASPADRANKRGRHFIVTVMWQSKCGGACHSSPAAPATHPHARPQSPPC